ncbi:hypothetical protein GCM10027566_23750 [Arachidicoccus ginsenosidivorans]|uniref:Uncharacterized protein n=1 Tax=Arachidicoccus ginsenosidivorans TaxID=496057 RepID=A0A5B8VK11_9BACT|nr:hypothetical protein FSB73_06045 [Arachidicoccus ginsenosidivorans]
MINGRQCLIGRLIYKLAGNCFIAAAFDDTVHVTVDDTVDDTVDNVDATDDTDDTDDTDSWVYDARKVRLIGGHDNKVHLLKFKENNP